MYEYHTKLLNVVDGDTVDVKVDLGFRIHREIRLRLAGIDTHEIHGVPADSEEYRKGIREKEFAENWFSEADTTDEEWPLIIRSEKTGKYGRYVAEVERRTDGAILNEYLVAEFSEAIQYS
jgi:micrococcal nuclease